TTAVVRISLSFRHIKPLVVPTIVRRANLDRRTRLDSRTCRSGARVLLSAAQFQGGAKSHTPTRASLDGLGAEGGLESRSDRHEDEIGRASGDDSGLRDR